MLRQVRCVDPDIVVLHEGGNDIDTKSGPPPQLVGMRVYTLAQALVRQGVRKVIASQVGRHNRWLHSSHMEETERVASMSVWLQPAAGRTA